MKVSHNSHFGYAMMVSSENVDFVKQTGSLKKALCKGMVLSSCVKAESGSRRHFGPAQNERR